MPRRGSSALLTLPKEIVSRSTSKSIQQCPNLGNNILDSVGSSEQSPNLSVPPSQLLQDLIAGQLKVGRLQRLGHDPVHCCGILAHPEQHFPREAEFESEVGNVVGDSAQHLFGE